MIDMEILAHAMSGCAAGAALACAKKSLPLRMAISAAGLLGGVIPDIDALSLAPGFDGTIGALFRLTHSGKEIFFGTFPYSHRMALHSLTAPFVTVTVIFLITTASGSRARDAAARMNKFRIAAAFILAYALHLFSDMATPAGVWGGIRLMYPVDITFGGWGLRWWWNNHDITIAGFLIASIAWISSFFTIIPGKIRDIAALSLLTVGIISCALTISRGTVDYNSAKLTYRTKHDLSVSYQKKTIGPGLFGIMQDLTTRISRRL